MNSAAKAGVTIIARAPARIVVFICIISSLWFFLIASSVAWAADLLGVRPRASGRSRRNLRSFVSAFTDHRCTNFRTASARSPIAMCSKRIGSEQRLARFVKAGRRSSSSKTEPSASAGLNLRSEPKMFILNINVLCMTLRLAFELARTRERKNRTLDRSFRFDQGRGPQPD